MVWVEERGVGRRMGEMKPRVKTKTKVPVIEQKCRNVDRKRERKSRGEGYGWRKEISFRLRADEKLLEPWEEGKGEDDFWGGGWPVRR